MQEIKFIQKEGKEIGKRYKTRTDVEIKEDLSKITDKKEQIKYWRGVIKEFNKVDRLNDKRHFRWEKRHEFSITNLDSAYSPEQIGIPIPQTLTNLCKPKDWDDIIHAQSVDDMHGLIIDPALSYIIKNLPQGQKEVLYYRVIKGYTAEKIAKIKGTCERNVRKLYEKALNHIREQYTPVIELKQKFEGQDYDIYPTNREKRFLERLLDELEKTA